MPSASDEPRDQARLACIALGSNLGDRAGNIAAAIVALGRLPGSMVQAVSPVIETAPASVRDDGGPAPDPGGPYLNAAATLSTTLSARALLTHLHAIEFAGGRDRSRQPHGAPRTIDLDLLLLGDAVIDEPGLVVPHPRLHERRFVLQPLACIAPDAVVPTLGRTVRQLLAALRPAALALIVMLAALAPSSHAQVPAPAVMLPAESLLDDAANALRARPSADRISIVLRVPRPTPSGMRDDITRSSILVRLDPGARAQEGVGEGRAASLAIEMGQLRAHGRNGVLTVVSTANPTSYWSQRYAEPSADQRSPLPAPASLFKIISPFPAPTLALAAGGGRASLLPWLGAAGADAAVTWEPVAVRPGERGPITLRGRSVSGPVAVDLVEHAPPGSRTPTLRLRRISATLPSPRGQAVPESARPTVELTLEPIDPGEASSWVLDLKGREAVRRLAELREQSGPPPLVGQRFPLGALKSTAGDLVPLDTLLAAQDGRPAATHLAMVLSRPSLAGAADPSVEVLAERVRRAIAAAESARPHDEESPLVVRVEVVLAEEPAPAPPSSPPWRYLAEAGALSRVGPAEPAYLVVIDRGLKMRVARALDAETPDDALADELRRELTSARP